MGLKKKIFKYLGIGFACAFSIFLLGNCEKVSAGDLTLNNGSVIENAEGTYFWEQINGGTSKLFIKKINENESENYTITIFKSDKVMVYTKCTFGYDSSNGNRFVCPSYYSIDNSTGDITMGTTSASSMNIEEYKYFKIEYWGGSSCSIKQYNSANTYDLKVTHSHYDYLVFGSQKYDEGVEVGKTSADITSDNEEYANQFIIDNNYHSNEEYLEYGETKYQEGKESVDITIDNEEYANQFIVDNNYHSNTDYLKYGAEQKQLGINSVDVNGAINTYIEENNMKTQEEYFKYGNERYLDGVASVDTESDNEYHYQLGFEDGKESVDIEIDNEEVFNQGYEQCKTDKSFKTKWTNFWKNIGELFSKFSTKIGLTKKEDMAI